jgi:large subunit ribosomal protein L19
MQNRILHLVESAHIKSDIPDIRVGDTIIVHQRILDGQKERIQPFEGDVIARSGSGTKEMLTVRRIVQSEGVERIFPIHSPRIARIEVKRAGRVRRAKLYYIRDRVGKATKIKGDVARQQQIDAAAKAAAEAAAKAAAEAAKAAREAAGTTGGESKRSQKRKAKAEAAKGK